MARLIEEIILKVGIDAATLNASLAQISKRLDTFSKKVNKLGDTTGKLDGALDKAGDQAKVTEDQFDKLEDEINPLDKGFDKLTKSVKKYNREAKKTNKSNKGMSKGFNDVAKAAVGLVGLSVVTDRLTELTTASLDAKRLGIATQELINLQSVAKTFGATSEDVVQGLKNINEWASIAFIDGKGAKFKAFKELNIDLKTFTKLNPSQQMQIFAEALSKVTNQGDKTRLALELMQEEGSKLANTMDGLAEKGTQLKASVQSWTGAMNDAKISRLNKKLSETKLRLDGVLNSFLDVGTDVFFSMEKDVSAVIFAMHGLNKAQEDFDDNLREEQAIGRKNVAALKKEKSDKEKAAKKAIKDQKEHTQLVKADMAEIEAREKKRNETLSESEKKFLEKERARIASAEDKIAKMEKSKKDAADKEVKDEERKKESAIKTIEGIALSRKKDLLKKLQENAQSSGAGIIEAGSVEEAELNASLQNRDAGKLDRIKNLKNEISAEELAREDKKISIAEKILKKIEPSHPLVINRRGL